MTDGRRREWIGALLGAIVVLLAWLLWPRDEPSDAAPRRAAASAVGTKPRGDRRRDAAAPGPSTEPDAAPPTPGAVEVSAKQEAEKSFPLTVTVVRADGSPAAGASVLLVDPDPFQGSDTLVGRATADDRGVAALRAPDCAVRVAAWLGTEATTTTELFDAKELDHATLRLAPAIVVRGRVLRGDVTEPGATVELSVRPWFGARIGYLLPTKTDADGRFEFPSIPTAGVDPTSPPTIVATTSDESRGFARVDVARHDAEVVVRLAPVFSVRARFLDEEGKPVRGDVFVVDEHRRQFPLDAEGRVALRLIEHEFRLIALRPTTATVPTDRPGGARETWHVAGLVAKSDEGATGDVDLGDVVLRAGKPVTGLVVDAAGKPAAGVAAALILGKFGAGSIVVGSTVADADGRFTFPEVGDDPHVVDVGGGRPGWGRLQIEGVRGGDPELRIALPTSKGLRFVLKFFAESDRAAVTSRNVHVRAWKHGETTACVDLQSFGDATNFADIRVPAAGAYDVEVAVFGYETQRFDGVQANAATSTVFDVLLRKKRD